MTVVAASGMEVTSASIEIPATDGAFSIRIPAEGGIAPGEYAVRVRVRPNANAGLPVADTARLIIAEKPSPLGEPVMWRRGPSTGPRYAMTADPRFTRHERVRFEMDLRGAIDRNELAVHYQPIVNLQDGRLVGFEALLRWHHAEFGMIPPNKFIPIAEQAGLIQQITVWVLNETCVQLAKWQAISPEYKEMMVSVSPNSTERRKP